MSSNLILGDFKQLSQNKTYIDNATRTIENFKEECDYKCPESIRPPESKVALNKLVLLPYRTELSNISITDVLEVVQALKSAEDYWDCLMNEIMSSGYEVCLPLIKAFSFMYLYNETGGEK